MTLRTTDLTKPALRVAAAGVGVWIFGPLGGVLGVWLGAKLGVAATELIHTYAESFSEHASVMLFELGADSIAERLSVSRMQLEYVGREALRLSLSEVRLKDQRHEDWFQNWDYCLASKDALALDRIMLTTCKEDLTDLLGETMERLDAFGAAMRAQDLSLKSRRRTIPSDLLSSLNIHLPTLLDQTFSALIVKPENEQAWKQAQQIFQQSNAALLRQIKETTCRTDETVKMVDERTAILPTIAQDAASTRQLVENLSSAFREQRLTEKQVESMKTEIGRLLEQKHELETQLLARATDPDDAELSSLLAASDYQGADRLKSRQVEMRRKEKDRLPQDLFELGTIRELLFHWPEALAAYREAWEMKRKHAFGVRYALCAQRLNCFSEAISVYEQLVEMQTDVRGRGLLLNVLALAYDFAGQIEQAGLAHNKALDIRRNLVKTNPEFKSDLATTLHNLGMHYVSTGHLEEAEQVVLEAYTIRQELTETNPEEYLEYLVTTLINLAMIFEHSGRTGEAEQLLVKTLAFFENLPIGFDIMPDGVPVFPSLLVNLGGLYGDAKRWQEAEGAFQKALAIYRRIAAIDSSHLSSVGGTLFNLGGLYANSGRPQEAGPAFREALSIFQRLAASNMEAHGPQVALVLTSLARLCRYTLQIQEGEAYCYKAEQILEPLLSQNPGFGEIMTVALYLHAEICEQLGVRSIHNSCDLARRAFEYAGPELKEQAKTLMERLCAKKDL